MRLLSIQTKVFPLRTVLMAALLACIAPVPAFSLQPPPSAGGGARIIHARLYNSGFSLADANYNAIFQASDGNIYYVLGSGSIDTGAQLFSLNPAMQKIQNLGDLTKASGEAGLHAIPQGKGHSPFVEFEGKLYFATHLGYYGPSKYKGVEAAGPVLPGYKPYPGGHFLAYDLATHQFTDIAKAPPGQGIISFAMDTQRQRLYGITWPSGEFLRYDLRTHNLRNFGSVFVEGEAGLPNWTYRAICRIMVLDPGDGSIYFTKDDGTIMQYRYDADSLESVDGVNLRRDVFGNTPPGTPGQLANSWRQAFWYAPQKTIYAVNGLSGWLYSFNPGTRQVTMLTRFASDQVRTSGMDNPFELGYLGFKLGPDGHTIYFLTGARSAQGTQMHLVTYDIRTGKQQDWGVLQLADGRRPSQCQSIEIGRNGMIYSVAWVRNPAPPGSHARGHETLDLISFPNPLAPAS